MATDFKAYKLIAIHAGGVCGLRVPSVADAAQLPDEELGRLVAMVSDDAQAAATAKVYQDEFDARLESRGYTIDQIVAWFSETYGPIARSSIARARASRRAKTLHITDAAESARAIVEEFSATGSDMTEAMLKMLGHYAFQLVYQLKADQDIDEKGPEIDKVAKLISAISTFAKQRAETEILKNKLKEIIGAAKADVDKSTAGGSKPITREEVFAMLDEAMKGGA